MVIVVSTPTTYGEYELQISEPFQLLIPSSSKTVLLNNYYQVLSDFIFLELGALAALAIIPLTALAIFIYKRRGYDK